MRDNARPYDPSEDLWSGPESQQSGMAQPSQAAERKEQVRERGYNEEWATRMWAGTLTVILTLSYASKR